MSTQQKLIYRFTLNAFKNGVQRILQGWVKGENLSRVLEISLTSGGEVYELPATGVSAVMYVKRPSQTDPSINVCTIDSENNKIIYNVTSDDIQEAGIVEMQLKIFDGIQTILVSPSFGMDVWDSMTNAEPPSSDPIYSALLAAIAEAEAYSQSALSQMYLEDDYTFVAEYVNGTKYESDAIKDAIAAAHAETTDAEAWAKGTKDGVPVTSSAPQYNNHSLYHSQISQAHANSSLAFANESNQHAQESNGYAQESRGYRNESHDYAETSKDYRDESSGYANESKGYRNQSQGYATESQGWVKEAEKWAVGTSEGTPVPVSDPTYNNYSKHWAEQAELLAERAEDAVDDCNDILAEIEKDIGNANFWVDDATGDLMYDNDSAYVFWVDEATGDLMMEVQV